MFTCSLSLSPYQKNYSNMKRRQDMCQVNFERMHEEAKRTCKSYTVYLASRNPSRVYPDDR